MCQIGTFRPDWSRSCNPLFYNYLYIDESAAEEPARRGAEAGSGVPRKNCPSAERFAGLGVKTAKPQPNIHFCYRWRRVLRETEVIQQNSRARRQRLTISDPRPQYLLLHLLGGLWQKYQYVSDTGVCPPPGAMSLFQQRFARHAQARVREEHPLELLIHAGQFGGSYLVAQVHNQVGVVQYPEIQGLIVAG